MQDTDGDVRSSPADREEAQLIGLAHYMERLKHIPRTGWVDRGVEDPESVAAHSWRLALLAWLLADRLHLDAGRAMRLALVHDLPEALTGDQLPFADGHLDAEARRRFAITPTDPDQWRTAERRARKTAREREALGTILEHAPEADARAIRSAWEEYEEGASPEARLVGQLDKLEAYLQGWEYARSGRIAEPSTLNSFRADTGRLVSDPALRAVLDALERWASSTAHDLDASASSPPAQAPARQEPPAR